jgi:hypothetical protein
MQLPLQAGKGAGKSRAVLKGCSGCHHINAFGGIITGCTKAGAWAQVLPGREPYDCPCSAAADNDDEGPAAGGGWRLLVLLCRVCASCCS